MIGWYISRLSRMGPGEIFWRLKALALHAGEFIDHKRGKWSLVPVPTVGEMKAVLSGYPVKEIPEDAFTGALPGRSGFLPIPDSIPDWHTDPSTGRSAPRRFSPLINPREPSLVGDIKVTWEINRHQWLCAKAYRDRSDQGVTFVCETLRDWMRENPPLTGVNWSSPMELGLRMISWALLFPIIAPVLEQDESLRRDLFRHVHEHLILIARHRSRYTSANNHVIGEMAGLYVGAVCFPFWPDCARWKVEARTLLEQELLMQTNDDGTNKEQALGYVLFVLELVTFAALLADRTADHFRPETIHRIFVIFQYLDEVRAGGYDLPWYGDNDSGLCYDVGDPAPHLARLFSLGASLFPSRAEHWLRPLSIPAIRSLFGVGERDRTPSTREQECVAPGLKIFRGGGLVLLQDRAGTFKVLFDCAPLGYLATAAHGHADALSLWVATRGGYLLTDSGTYCYHSHPEWRRYMRGTAAHNTVRVDGVDQSVMAGRFIWRKHAVAVCTSCSMEGEKMIVRGEHDGYTRLDDPVIHKRSLVLAGDGRTLDIVDTLECARKHFVELMFHLHPAAHAGAGAAGRMQIEFAGASYQLQIDSSVLSIRVARGEPEPLLGWYSVTFGSVEPTSTIVASGWIEGTTTITSSLQAE